MSNEAARHSPELRAKSAVPGCTHVLRIDQVSAECTQPLITHSNLPQSSVPFSLRRVSFCFVECGLWFIIRDTKFECKTER